MGTDNVKYLMEGNSGYCWAPQNQHQGKCTAEAHENMYIYSTAKKSLNDSVQDYRSPLQNIYHPHTHIYTYTITNRPAKVYSRIQETATNSTMKYVCHRHPSMYVSVAPQRIQ